ncbi:MAG: 5-(carboxyamino)imidazole ribonucleotide mutase [Chitinispirillaceae bacterium]|nr:5-(carboxyamino)imidazole ribonucleotide mutase [Chitinispirillaceae bacterium]
MKKVAIVMGSETDMNIAEKAVTILKEFGVEHTVSVISAHRNPNRIRTFALSLQEQNVGVVIAIAGLAAHLSGVVASLTVVPVIGVPGSGGPLSGQDALYSIVQMPGGIPVACVGIGNAKNAALLAVQILGTAESELVGKMLEYRKKFGDDAG